MKFRNLDQRITVPLVLMATFLNFFFIESPYADEGKKLKIVATTSTFADIASEIGGDHVETTSIAPPRFNVHFIEPRPTDVLRVKRASLFIHAGLDLELWRGPLVDAAGRAAVRPGGERELDLSSVIKLLDVPTGPVSRSEGDIHLFGNPHYWQDPRNGKAIAQGISSKLIEMDPVHKKAYEASLANFISKLELKMSEWTQLRSTFRNTELIAYHNEWVYLTEFLGVEIQYFLEPKPGISPGPKHIEFLRDYIQERNIPGIVQASYYPKKASNSLARDTGASVEVLCQNVSELESCSSYIEMLDFNVHSIAGLLGNG
mgnify:FL=1